MNVKHSIASIITSAALATTACGTDNGAPGTGESVATSAQAVTVAGLDADTDLYTPEPNPGAVEQIRKLLRRHRSDAKKLGEMIETPQASWFTQGTPRSVKRDVKKLMKDAKKKREVPVLVAYNLPFRDCAQFSAGGATNAAEYRAWIDGFAEGIGDAEVIVILEPDGLGIIPFYNPFADRDTWLDNPDTPELEQNALEWCQPAEGDPATASADRFAMLNYAVDRLKQNPNAHVYLDGTHSAWLGAGDAADRLYQAGVLRTDGFYLNASNYRADEHLVKYGTWIAKCIWFGDPASGSWGAGHFEWCASQYSSPGGTDPNDFATWVNTDAWYVDNVESQTWVPYPGDAGLNHFVIDSSRNGQGPWTPPEHPEGDAQDWCNPPDRGLGTRPTADTGVALLDAYLWIKIPGESDGECNRWEPLGSPDPVRGYVNPAAGEWFPEMALELVNNANPPVVVSHGHGHGHGHGHRR